MSTPLTLANDSPKVCPSAPVLIQFVSATHDMTSSPVVPPSSISDLVTAPVPTELLLDNLDEPLSPTPTLSSTDSSVPAANTDPAPPSISVDAAHTTAATAPFPTNLVPVPPSHHPMTTRLHDGTRRPKSFPNYKLFLSTKHPLMAFHSHVNLKHLPPAPTRFS